jgi:hypothetical protein
MEKLTEDQKLKDYIERESERFATANCYLLDNTYLTKSEKLEVELWFQFPDKILFLSFCFCTLYFTFSSMPIKLLIFLPLMLDIIIGLINWSVNLKRFLKYFYLTIGHNFVLWGITIATCGILIYFGHYILAIITLIAKIGLFALISPSLCVYTILSKRYGMHAKWVYFKKFYNRKFPFENEIEEPF